MRREAQRKNTLKIANDSELRVREKFVENVSRIGKKRRVELHAMWTRADRVVAL